MRYSEELRNAGLDARIALLGPGSVLKIFGEALEEFDGKEPEALLSIKLPDPWMSKASNGTISKRGVWAAKASGTGKAKSFRICDAKGRPHMQGEVPKDMTLDNDDIKKGQTAGVQVFVIASGNG